MGDLVADAMLDRVKGQGVTIAPAERRRPARLDRRPAPSPMGDVLAVLPFQNTLSTFNITGAGIVAALENGVSQVEEGAGRFPQVSGLRFSWDPKVAPMQGRIKSVEVREGDAWVPIDPAKVYSVATQQLHARRRRRLRLAARRGDQRLRLRPRPRGRARRLPRRAPGLRRRRRAADHPASSEAALSGSAGCRARRRGRRPVGAAAVDDDRRPAGWSAQAGMNVVALPASASRARTRSSACTGAR